MEELRVLRTGCAFGTKELKDEIDKQYQDSLLCFSLTLIYSFHGCMNLTFSAVEQEKWRLLLESLYFFFISSSLELPYFRPCGGVGSRVQVAYYVHGYFKLLISPRKTVEILPCASSWQCQLWSWHWSVQIHDETILLLEIVWYSPLLRTGPPAAGSPGPSAGGFGVSPRMETPQTLWTVFSSV